MIKLQKLSLKIYHKLLYSMDVCYIKLAENRVFFTIFEKTVAKQHHYLLYSRYQEALSYNLNKDTYPVQDQSN